MLWLNKGKRTFLQDRQLGSSLALVAGALNSAGFLSVGYYCANMTGNVSTLASAFVAGKLQAALMAGAIVLCFLAGAVTCTLLMNNGRRRGQGAIYAFTILLEAILLCGLACAQLIWQPKDIPSSISPLLLSFLMGLQNATVTRVSGAVVRTTHVTGMVTDLGIELADWFSSFRQKEDAEKHRKMQQRLWLHSQIIGCFIIGSGLGVYGYTYWPTGFLFIVAGILACLSLPGIMININRDTKDASQTG